jgi:hypothetical protein
MKRSAAFTLALVGPFLFATSAFPAAPRDGAAGYTVACALTDQPGLQSCADLPEAQACAQEPDFASRASKEATGMVFVNRSGAAIRIYWMDFQGYRQLYRILAPGARFSQSTFIGHYWLVTNAGQHCVAIFKAAPESLAFF